MSEERLTREGHQRLHARLVKEREQLLETEEFIRQQLLCKCDVDQLSLLEAKEQKMQLQQQVEGLEQVLARATVLEGRNDQTADLGAFVTLLHEGTREPMEVQLVSSHEASVTEEAVPHISDASPVGQQLLGRRIGDRIQVRTGDGVATHYQVTAIRYLTFLLVASDLSHLFVSEVRTGWLRFDALDRACGHWGRAPKALEKGPLSCF